MRTLLLAFLITFASGVSATSLNDPDNEQNGLAGQVDEQGRKQGRWIYLGKHKPEKGYAAESKIEEGDYKDNRKEGEWINYYKNGSVMAKRNFVNGTIKGAFEKLSEDGVVLKKGTIDKTKGGYQKKLEMNYPDGTPKYRGQYNEAGKEHGDIVKYHPNGVPSLKYNMNAGLKTKCVYYYANGDVKRTVSYGPDGKATSTVEQERVNPETVVEESNAGNKAAVMPKGADMKGKSFKADDFNKLYKNGEIWQDGLFKKGRLYDGKIYKYDSDGLIQKVEIYKNGKYHSDGQF
jgi:antitoxin component YwqK of YwqJK toxin-antitoxin module